jgi:undecaprenyl-diphosphatase
MPFSLWQVIVLAVLQGIAEFLPISSDGHLVVLAPLLFSNSNKPPADMTSLNITLHLGTLGSILVYYRQRITKLLIEDRRTIGLIVLGTIPAVIVGLPMKKWGEGLLESPLIAGFMFFVTGAAVLWISRHRPGTTEYQQLRWRDALLIGIAQATAILPGLSRSGTTIAMGVTRGMSRPSAATFSFLLAIPAIAGAGVLEVLSQIGEKPPLTPYSLLVAGAVISFGVGIAALWWLERLLKSGRLEWFAWYCFALGAVVLVWRVPLAMA